MEYIYIYQDKLYAAAAAAKSLQSCPTLCDPIDGSPPGSPVPGILQARTLEWVAIAFSNAWKWKVKVKSLSHVWFFRTPWIASYQVPPPMGFSRQELWSGVPLPSPTNSILAHKCKITKVGQTAVFKHQRIKLEIKNRKIIFFRKVIFNIQTPRN